MSGDTAVPFAVLIGFMLFGVSAAYFGLSGFWVFLGGAAAVLTSPFTLLGAAVAVVLLSRFNFLLLAVALSCVLLALDAVRLQDHWRTVGIEPSYPRFFLQYLFGLVPILAAAQLVRLAIQRSKP